TNGTFTAHRWRTSESWDTIPYSHHPYAYALGDPILYTDPAGTYAIADPDGGGSRSSNPCTRISDQQERLLCEANRRMQGSGAAKNTQEQVAPCPDGTFDVSILGFSRSC